MLSKTFEKNWFILQVLVSKDFKRKYRRSALGIAWSVLNPLLMMIVMSAVFSYMFKFDIENFPLYLILGNVLFGFMSTSTSSALTSMLEAAPLIKKVRVEKMLFPLEAVFFNLVNFAISLIAVVIVLVWFRIIPGITIFLMPVLLVYVLIFCTGLGLLLSALVVFFRDVIHFWGVILTAWTYATPLFYPVSMLEPWMQTVMMFNPMYHYVTYFRDITMYNTAPSLEANAICFGMAIITFIIGFIVFRKTEHKFILHI